jgi:DNA-binding NarL/FixJ family response regulator
MSRVLVIDSNAIFRLGLREVIKAVEPRMAVVEADTFIKAHAVLRTRSDIALIMLDVRVPDCGGLIGLSQLRNEYPDIPVIMLSSDPKTDLAGRVAASGAAGIIQKSASCKAMRDSLRSVLSGRVGPTPVISNAETFSSPLDSLSPALLRVLMGVKRGLRNKEIAFELGLSEKTIKAYLGILYRKLGVTNRTQAVILLQEVLAETELAYAAPSRAAHSA